jgi:transketolase
MRTLPGLTVVIPADSAQATTAIRDTHDIPGPAYYSLGKDDRISVAGLNGRFALGKVQEVRHGSDLAIVTMGCISQEAVTAAEELSGHGIAAAVYVVSNFSPDPEADLARALAGFRCAISVEAHTASGGLGAFVATAIATHGLACRLRIMAVRTPPDGTSGKQTERWRKYGLDRSGIVKTALGALDA